MKYYLAGPMSGRPKFNYPQFDKVAQGLRKIGYDVYSPAEMDSPATRKAAMKSKDGKLTKEFETGETWGDFLSRDVKLLADRLDAIILLPNWYMSKGARLEAFVSVTLGYPAWTVDPTTLNMRTITPTQIMEKISESVL